MSHDISVLIVSDAWIRINDQIALHPALAAWRQALSRLSGRWFAADSKTPLAWYAALSRQQPAAIVASKIRLPEGISQCWLASPYHAVLGREHVHVLPDGLFPFSTDDAAWLCRLLNPMLAEEGLQLVHAGAAMLLACRKPIHATPASFAEIAGHLLPDRHPEGEDAGLLTRLEAEIQMLLHAHAFGPRRERDEPDIHGLWFWGPVNWPSALPQDMMPAASRNPALRSVAEAKDARVMISEADRLEQLLESGRPLPPHVCLAGEGRALWLIRALLPRRNALQWREQEPMNDERALLQTLEHSLG